MPPEAAEITDASGKRTSTFMRQSGWLMFANMAAGALMWAIHFLAKRLPDSEYGAFGALLTMTLVVPMLPLQMVFAQATAKALATGERAQLARMIRRSCLGLFLVWLAGALVLSFFSGSLIRNWHLADPAGYWVTVLGLYSSIMLPMLWGLMQGKQDFFGLGISMIVNGAGRFLGAALIVFILAGQAAGMMTGLVLGCMVAVGHGAYITRDLWLGTGEPFDRREILNQAIPLALGFGACQVLFTADTMFVKAWFPGRETDFYFAAGTLSRALMWFVLPLAAVMFPKIVHSRARAEKTNLLMFTLMGTGALAVAGAFGLWLLGPFVIRLVYTPAFVAPTLALLPWYAGAIVPLAMGNVLANHLLAKGDYRVVPWLVLLAGGFVGALCFAHTTMVHVLQVLAACNLLFLLLCVVFTWTLKRKPDSNQGPGG
jgi:O-antigen/teichoic acid export membrane protein